METATRLREKLASAFPDAEEQERAREILRRYGTEPYEHEAERVRLAILRLAGNAPDLDRLAEVTQSAKVDYRDVLAWAEYPRQMAAGPGTDAAEQEKRIQADREEYTKWLNEP